MMISKFSELFLSRKETIFTSVLALANDLKGLVISRMDNRAFISDTIPCSLLVDWRKNLVPFSQIFVLEIGRKRKSRGERPSLNYSKSAEGLSRFPSSLLTFSLFSTTGLVSPYTTTVSSLFIASKNFIDF